jgi:glycosyltransferase involved in cell wall biosynthesis
LKLLHLTPELPFAPGGTGGATRQFELLRGLVRRGHEVAVVAPVASGQPASLLRDAGVRLYAYDRPPSRVSEALHALSPRLAARALSDPVVAWQVEVFWTSLRPLAQRALAEFSPDRLLVEHDWAAAWHRDLPDLPRALTLQNLSWRYYGARARAASGPRALALGLEARRFARFDRRHLRAYDVLLAMSDEDRDAAAAFTGARVEAVPNGVDTSALGPFGDPDGPPTLLYTGTLDYAPNAEGLRWLLREVWPRLSGRAELLVVGRNPPEDAVRSAGPGVTFTGRVPEIAPYFVRAHAVLVPLRSGAGTKLKVLDGLASGRPVVSTSVGVEGIAAEDGRHLLVADGGEAFADAVVRVLDDAALRARLGAEGRALAEERYDWQVLSARFEQILESLR